MSGKESSPASFHIAEATDAEWAWFVPRYAQTAWESINSRRQAQTTLLAIRESLESQILQMRSPEGKPHAAYAVFADARVPLGFVWVIEAHSGFTETSYAWVMCVYVEEEARGRGLGRALLASAEAWARSRGLDEIVLNVAAWHDDARRLYEAEGYAVETLNYRKHIR